MSKLLADEEWSSDNELNNIFFQNSPVPILVEDLSGVKSYYQELERNGITDIEGYFDKNSDEILNIVEKVKIVEVNDAALKLCRAENKNDLCGSLCLVHNKESYDTFRKIVISLFQGHREYYSEIVLQTLTKEEIQVYLKLVVPPAYENTLSKVIINLIDISDYKRKLDTIQKSEEKYRKLFENAEHATFLIDGEIGIVLEANKKALHLVGMSADKFVGMHFTQIYPRREAEYFRNLFEQKVEEGFYSESAIINHEKGKKIPVAVSGKLLEVKNRRVFSCVLREIQRGESVKNSQLLNDKLHVLTLREREIFHLIASGVTNKQMSEKLYISKKTIETHRANIMHKLNLHNEADIVRHAISL